MAHRDSRLHARPHHEQRRLRPPLGKHLVFAYERGHGRGEADAVDRPEVDEAADERAELVAGAVRLGGDAPVLSEGAVLEEPEHRLRVSDVDREQHAAILGASRLERRGGQASSSRGMASPMRSASASGVSVGSSPSRRSSSTVRSVEV